MDFLQSAVMSNVDLGGLVRHCSVENCVKVLNSNTLKGVCVGITGLKLTQMLSSWGEFEDEKDHINPRPLHFDAVPGLTEMFVDLGCIRRFNPAAFRKLVIATDELIKVYMDAPELPDCDADVRYTDKLTSVYKCTSASRRCARYFSKIERAIPAGAGEHLEVFTALKREVQAQLAEVQAAVRAKCEY